MKGRALIDLPAHELKCGEFGEIPDDIAAPLVADGYFDAKAVSADAPEPQKPPRKRKE